MKSSRADEIRNSRILHAVEVEVHTTLFGAGNGRVGVGGEGSVGGCSAAQS